MAKKELQSLVKALDVGYRYRPHQMLSYFLSSTMALWGLPEWEPVPQDVQAQIFKAQNVYSELVATEEPFFDILGPLYMEMGSHGARAQLGQFFTPWNIATAMAMMSMAPAPDEPITRACDPTCGSGVMMLAFAAEALKQWGPERLQQLSITGVDLDGYCARMTAVQLIANCNIHRVRLGEILVMRGNSLMPWEDLDVIVHAHAPGVRVYPALAPARLQAIAQAAGSALPLPAVEQPAVAQVG